MNHGLAFLHRQISTGTSPSLPAVETMANSGGSGPGNNSSSIGSSSGLYDVSMMAAQNIRRRVLHPFSVHYSLPTSNYIATITRHCDPNCSGGGDHCSRSKTRYVQFSFSTQREAQRFAKAYCPPKMMDATPQCSICSTPFRARPLSLPDSSNITATDTVTNNNHNSSSATPNSYSHRISENGNSHNHHKSSSRVFCKNCGICVCTNCTVRWGKKMIPKTYIHSSHQAATVRVCKSCDWLSNAFCMSLIRGKYEDALAIYSSGNVNLRTCFADIRKEAMFPVHCAVMGGSLELVKWLVDTQCCPISVKRDSTGNMLSVVTSASRTLIDLAMTGKPKIHILIYLVKYCGLSVTDVKDATIASKTLDILLKADFIVDAATNISSHGNAAAAASLSSLNSHSNEISPSHFDIDIVANEESTVMTSIEDPCNICCERAMDCAFVPCGHQVCCSECGKHIHNCPICKVKCTVLKIYRT